MQQKSLIVLKVKIGENDLGVGTVGEYMGILGCKLLDSRGMFLQRGASFSFRGVLFPVMEEFGVYNEEAEKLIMEAMQDAMLNPGIVEGDIWVPESRHPIYDKKLGRDAAQVEVGDGWLKGCIGSFMNGVVSRKKDTGVDVMNEPRCRHCREPIRKVADDIGKPDGEAQWTHVYDMGVTRTRCYAATRAELGNSYQDELDVIQKPSAAAQEQLNALDVNLELNQDGQLDAGGKDLGDGYWAVSSEQLLCKECSGPLKGMEQIGTKARIYPTCFCSALCKDAFNKKVEEDYNSTCI